MDAKPWWSRAKRLVACASLVPAGLDVDRIGWGEKHKSRTWIFLDSSSELPLYVHRKMGARHAASTWIPVPVEGFWIMTHSLIKTIPKSGHRWHINVRFSFLFCVCTCAYDCLRVTLKAIIRHEIASNCMLTASVWIKGHVCLYLWALFCMLFQWLISYKFS